MAKEIIIASLEDLENIYRRIHNEFEKSKVQNVALGESEKLNQKQAAIFLGITESTLIRWKKSGLVPCDQLPGSSKVTYFKSQLKAVLQRNPSLLQTPRK